MTTHQSKMLLPGAQTPEGVARINTALDARNRVDFECYQLLTQMQNNGMANASFFMAGFKRDPDMDLEEAQELSDYYDEQITTLIRRRRDAQQEWTSALVGRPA
jgi:hypothetical protein